MMLRGLLLRGFRSPIRGRSPVDAVRFIAFHESMLSSRHTAVRWIDTILPARARLDDIAASIYDY